MGVEDGVPVGETVGTPVGTRVGLGVVGTVGGVGEVGEFVCVGDRVVGCGVGAWLVGDLDVGALEVGCLVGIVVGSGAGVDEAKPG